MLLLFVDVDVEVHVEVDVDRLAIPHLIDIVSRFSILRPIGGSMGDELVRSVKN